jgi:hypothetical protein
LNFSTDSVAIRYSLLTASGARMRCTFRGGRGGDLPLGFLSKVCSFEEAAQPLRSSS